MRQLQKQIRQIVSGNNINHVSDVYELLWDNFKVILHELLEAELGITLGYGKNHTGNLTTDNKNNGHSPKTLKSQDGEFQIDVPRTTTGSLS